MTESFAANGSRRHDEVSSAEGALIDGTNCRLFPVGDVAAAADALESLAAPEVRARLVAGESGLVRRRYSRAASIRQSAEALERVVATGIIRRLQRNRILRWILRK